MLGCGTLVVSDASEQGRVRLHDIPHVEQVHLAISDLLFGHTDASPGTTASMTEPEPRFTRQALEGAILGENPSLTSEEVAEAAGVTLEEARRLWRALGFPDAGDEAAFTDGDRAALSTMVGAVDRGRDRLRHRRAADPRGRADDGPARRLGGGHPLGPGRAARGRRRGHRQPGRQRAAARRGGRRALRAAAGLLLAPAPRGRGRPGRGARRQRRRPAHHEVTVGFADLVRFTALSNELDEDRIGDLVEIFESRCADVVAQQRGRVIKTLGDSVLFVSEDPTRAMDIALSIVDVIGHDSRLPDVRIGLATGSVIMQLGDVFGPPVNMAARLTGVARRNRVITDRATSDLLSPGQFESRPLPARPLRGFGDRRAGRRTPALSGLRGRLACRPVRKRSTTE